MPLSKLVCNTKQSYVDSQCSTIPKQYICLYQSQLQPYPVPRSLSLSLPTNCCICLSERLSASVRSLRSWLCCEYVYLTVCQPTCCLFNGHCWSAGRCSPVRLLVCPSARLPVCPLVCPPVRLLVRPSVADANCPAEWCMRSAALTSTRTRSGTTRQATTWSLPSQTPAHSKWGQFGGEGVMESEGESRGEG